MSGLGEDEEPVSPRRGFLTALWAECIEPADDRIVGGDLLGGERCGRGGVGRAGRWESSSASGSAAGTWDVTLAGGTALVGRAAGERLLRVVDAVAGIGLICFGAALAYSVLSN